MIYYLIIPSNGTPSTSFQGSGRLHGLAIKNHSDMGAKSPNLVNEMQCSIIVADVDSLKKINFTKDDEVRLCLHHDSGYPVTNQFDINGIKNTTDIYDYLKKAQVKINSNVVYV